MLVLAVVVLIGVMAWSTIRVVVAGLSDDRSPTSALVVLGASQYDGQPSAILAARLDHAAALFEAGVADTIVTVGGKQPGDRFTEAEAGAAYLQDAGVPAEATLAVESGSDTWTSVQAVAEVLGSGTRVTVVTDPAHALRSTEMAAVAGLDAVASPVQNGPAAPVWAQPRYVVRETVGWWAFQWFRWTGNQPGVTAPDAL
jgi:uncharacterized SAM-binding protein YcdF (DUF218 family)